jgi:hypothetical protein
VPTNLPVSRSYTLIPGSSEVPASLLDELQDCIIGNKKPAMWRGGLAFSVGASVGWEKDGIGARPIGPAFAMGVLEMPYEEGDRITGFEMRVFGDGVTDLTINITKGLSGSSGIVPLGTLSLSNHPAVPSWVTIPITPATIGAGEFLYATVAASAASATLVVLAYRLGYDRL